MKTVCHEQLTFSSIDFQPLVATFDGGTITSDAGALLLREIDRKTGLIDAINSALEDPRMPGKIDHQQAELLRQRIFAIAHGYEDANDHQTLRSDPSLKAAVGRRPDGCDLASQPTLCRLENRADRRALLRIADALIEHYIASHPGPRELIVLDVDSTDDPTHGHQQLSLFHGYFDQYMFHPLLVFDGQSGFPLAAVLRPGNAHAARGAVAILKRIIARLKAAYPGARILLRADAGFASPAIYELLERSAVDYVIGLITNGRLRRKVSALSAVVEKDFAETGFKQRRFTAFGYRADSWGRRRRVIAKVERLSKGLNTRFVVTNISVGAPLSIYDGIYTGRGEAENRIKELKNHLKADRLSCNSFLANQFRLLLHTFAYVLMLHLRRSLRGTELATATVATLRLKLLKIGARVTQSVRRIVFSLPGAYPYKELLATALARIKLMEQMAT